MKDTPLVGLDILVKYGLMNDVRWDVQGYNYKKMMKTFSDSDKELLNALDYIGDGELSGTTMFAQLLSLIEAEYKKKGKYGNLVDFTEATMYGMMVITYDEFRHGMVLKELKACRDGEKFHEVISSTKAHEYIAGKQIWKNPYEILVSLFLGEIINEAMYKSLRNIIDNKDFKKIISFIEKDERRHKMAWFELTRKLIEKPKHRKKYIKALKRVHIFHQAEVGYTFTEGMTETNKVMTKDLMDKIHEDRYKMLVKLLGNDMPMTKEEMKAEHGKHAIELIKEKMIKEQK